MYLYLNEYSEMCLYVITVVNQITYIQLLNRSNIC